MAHVSVSGLSKRFGTTEVLKQISVEIPDGSFAVLVGPSGCGKSTLLRLLAGLDYADRGNIKFDARDVTELEPRDRDIAMVFQSYALYPHLSVRDNLAFGLKLRKTSPAEITKRVEEASELLGLVDLLDRFPRALSGGQRQRVAMGRAIVRRPSLFLFDEPLSNLDAALRSDVRIEIRKLHDRLKATSVYVTHDQVEAMTLADILFVLNRGAIEQAGPPLEVYANPRTKFVASFLGSPSMNFLSVQIEAAGDRLCATGSDGLQISNLPNKFAPHDLHGREAILGIRPQDLRMDREHSMIALRVLYVEALGTETYAHGSLGGAPFVARLDSTANVKPGDMLPLSFDNAHLFDPKTGMVWGRE